MNNERSQPDLAVELADLRLRLAEAEETLNAIRNGEVDGLVVAGSDGQQVFTLQGAQEPYRLLIEQMSEGALTLSLDGIILYANHTFAKMIQMPAGQIIGVALRDFIAPTDHPALAHMLEAALSGLTSVDVSILAASGIVVQVRLGLSRLQLGEESLLCAIATDITLDKKTEADKARLADDLEVEIESRITEIAASRLAVMSMMEDAFEAREVAETTNRALTVEIKERKRAEILVRQSALELQQKNAELERFLYAASHDLKSPIVTVRTFVGYLEQDIASGDAVRLAKDFDFIRVATDKMVQLLNDLLDVARVGHLVSATVNVTFRALVDGAIGAVAGRIAERGVTMQVNPVDLELNGDRARLAEVFQNLIDNACKFMGDQKEPCIEIGIAGNNGETVFFVRDNGIGIDSRFQAKIFDLFEKIDTEVEGTGIGLALVKRIVEVNQGRIWVESAGLDQGACFFFTLPGAVKEKTEDSSQNTGVGVGEVYRSRKTEVGDGSRKENGDDGEDI